MQSTFAFLQSAESDKPDELLRRGGLHPAAVCEERRRGRQVKRLQAQSTADSHESGCQWRDWSRHNWSSGTGHNAHGAQNSVAGLSERNATPTTFTTSTMSVAPEQLTSVVSFGQSRLGSTMAGAARKATPIVLTTSTMSQRIPSHAGSPWQSQAHSHASPIPFSFRSA